MSISNISCFYYVLSNRKLKYKDFEKINKKDDFFSDWEGIRQKTSTPCTFDTAYSSLSPISINECFEETEPRSSTEQFKQNESKVQNYLNSIPDHIGVLTDDDEIISHASSKCSTVLPDPKLEPEKYFIEYFKFMVKQKLDLEALNIDESIISLLQNIFQNNKKVEKQKSIKTTDSKRKIDIKRNSIDEKSMASVDSSSTNNGTLPKKRRTLRNLSDTKSRPTTPIESTNNFLKTKMDLEQLKIEKKAEKEKQNHELITSFIIKSKAQNYLLKGLPKDIMCRVCLKPGNVQRCSGACAGYYHKDCLGTPEGKNNDWYNELCKRTNQLATKIHVTGDEIISNQNVETATSQTEFTCLNCINSKVPPCFVCKKDDEELLRCSEKNCGRTFHYNCLKYWPQHKIKYSGEKMGLLCPCHMCQICISDNPRASNNVENDKKLMKCMLCPATYHRLSCCIPAGSELLSENQLVCPRHRTNRKNPVNTNWCFLCSRGGSLICCETCPTSFHQECLKIEPADTDAYICEECESGRLPLYGEIVWAKMGQCKW